MCSFYCSIDDTMMKVSDSKSSQILLVKIISGKPNKKLPVGFEKNSRAL